MPEKALAYTQLAEQTAKQITGSYREWTAFLTTAARLYKYPYHEQLMIYAQRPDATACAEYDIWNNTMRRYVRRGAKGIALLNPTENGMNIRYVFDAADTGGGENSRTPFIWALEERHTQAVRDMLHQTYDAPVHFTLPAQIEHISRELAASYWEEHQRDILDIVDGSFLEEYDDFNVGASFRKATAVSISYALQSRCGLNPANRYDHEDFMEIFDWNTPDTLTALGTAVSQINQQVLRQIEVVVKNIERSYENERTELRAERGLSDSLPEPERNGNTATSQVRENAPELSRGTSSNIVQFPAPVRETDDALAGDRAGIEEPTGANHDLAEASAEPDRTDESTQSDRVDSADEQPESPSGGNDPVGIDLRLTDTSRQSQQLSFFPTEDQQIYAITEAESAHQAPFASSFSQENVDHVLRLGSNTTEHRLLIATDFMKQKSPDEIATHLRQIHRGGNGFQINGIKYSAWYGDEGIRIAHGSQARYVNTAQTISWEDAASRIGVLMDEGNYATLMDIATAPGYERKQLAISIWNLYWDIDAQDHEYLSAVGGIQRSGFPEETAQLADLLADPVFADALTEQMQAFISAYEQDHSLLRFRHHRLQNILQNLQELALPRRDYTSQLTEIPSMQPFITDDEINQQLATGSSFEGGKGRIYRYFSEPQPTTEKAAFLKKEYGTGGRSHALSGADGSSEDHSAKGITLKKRDCSAVHLNWNQVVKRIDDLMRKDRYLTANEKQQLEQANVENVLSIGQVSEPEAQAPQLDTAPDRQEIYARYKPFVMQQLLSDSHYINACRYSDEDNIRTEAEATIRRAVNSIVDTDFMKLYYDDLDFHDRLHDEIMEESYLILSEQLEEAVQPEREQVQRPEAEDQDNEPAVVADPVSAIAEQPGKPQPVFFVNWEEAQHDFDLKRYSDRDVVGYDKDGVQYAVGKSGNLTYITSTGVLWGGNSVPGNIYEQIHAYADGELTAEQVRENYLQVISPEAIQPGPTAEQTEETSLEEQVRLELDRRGFDVSNELLKNWLSDFHAHGGHGDFQDAADFIEDEYFLGYELDYSYYNDRLIVRNVKDATPDDLPDIIARVEPDGSIVYIDENLPEAVQREIERVAADDLEMYKDAAEARFQRMMRAAEAVIAADDVEESPVPTPIAAPAQNRIDFRITNDHLGEGGAKTKYDFNITAIRLLKEIEMENRIATPEEQETLSRYVGWGGIPQAFDNTHTGWSSEYTELKDILTPEEYDAARASTLNAHYTSPTVIRAIYEGIHQMGFESGNVLEPACGVGNFFGLLPESMQNSRLYGVELDGISGRIAKQLYPNANITISGFEQTNRKDFFDLAIGNVPFGAYQVQDRAFDKHRFMIHDYFFAKALEQVRPGGVIAFITSKGTLDKRSPEVRKYIAERAELLGAIRLPNTAFKQNAGTEVTSDILFLQKREQPIVIDEDWTHLGQTEDGIPVNSYFAEHPEMVLGTMVWDDSMYGNQKETACLPLEGAVLSEQLAVAVQNIQGQYTQASLPDIADGEAVRDTIPADPDVKNFSYTVVDGEVYYRENSIMVQPDANQTVKERIRGLVELRTCVNELIEAQLEEHGDDAIHAHQQRLNTLYDAFTAKHGLINARANALAFSDDSSYYLLCSLEILNEQNELERKADMFTQRTIRRQQTIERVDTSAEALAVSIGEKACVDLPYMAMLSSKEETVLAQELSGVIFPLPYSEPIRYVTADEYLSGNVREKLREAKRAAEQDLQFEPNVTALEAAQPKDLDASEIDVRLGATWVDKAYIQQFMYETFATSFVYQRAIEVHYSPFTAEWNITGKKAIPGNNVAAYVTYGTDRANAYKILEDTLNLRDVRIYDIKRDAEGKEKRVLNQKETMLAQQKQQSIKDAFRDWVWRDPTRRETLVTQYNEQFNAVRPREYDGQHITFGGISPEITLREHQRNAVARILYGGNTLLAHVVGAGKTFEMVAATMESKRLGLCQKAMFVVPNHLTEQWASEFLRLYPSANILVTTRKDFEKANRQKFCARIATGDYDAVIIGHSQFERIPISKERQERLLHDQITEIVFGLDELKRNRGEQFSIKQLERTKKQLESKLKKLQAEDKKDDVVTFEQLGVDRLYVDEAHGFKNLFLFSKMRNVAGLSTSEAQKSSDMFMKCRYMDELTGGRGVVFATGTPISNSMTELYTMQRYLQYHTLSQKSLTHFDAWASTFGETTTAIELAPEGTGYRARTRFAKFFNLPELMTMFGEVADIKTAEHLNLDTPEAHYETVVVKPSDLQKEMVQALSERAAEVHRGNVDPTIDNMLKITSDGRKLGLDQRLMNPLLPDDPLSKVNACVDNIYRIWDEGHDKKLTQLVFCDISTPKGTPQSNTLSDVDIPSDHFNVYDDIRSKLLAQGIPAEQVAFIHEANTEARKKELFAKVRSGQVRVLMGSTAKMGAGTNVQDRLIALHDVDCPWRPGDLEQRAGRIVRQGNQNKEVSIYRYVTEGTFDAYLWQTVENKQKFISQIMSGKSPVRACDDVDETSLSYAEIKALCAGDVRIKEKMDLDVDVARLRLMKADHQSKQYRLEDQLLKYFPQQVEQDTRLIDGIKKDIELLSKHPLPEKDFVGMEANGRFISDKEVAGMAILEACKDAAHGKEVMVGHYRGFAMHASYDSFSSHFNLALKGTVSYRMEIGADARGNLTRIENALAQIPSRLTGTEEHLSGIYQQIEAAKQEVGKPFPQDDELKTKAARLAELDASLNMDKPEPVSMAQEAEDDSLDADEVSTEKRPSVLASLKAPCVHGKAKTNTAERDCCEER